MTDLAATRAGDPPLDLWSVAHLASGVALGGLAAPFWLVVFLLVIYEGFEALLRRKRSGKGIFEHESRLNIFVDVVVGLAGWAATRWVLTGHL